MSFPFKRYLGIPVTAIGLLLPLGQAHAVPSFARQLGVSCAACHTAFPQLTPFGRQFKLLGYTMQNEPKVQTNKGKRLDIDRWAPLSLMVMVSDTLPQHPGQGNDSNQFEFPNQLSLFYAGAITNHIGTFLQYTAGDGGAFSFDNTDVRYADQTSLGDTSVIYGVDLNNNPTVQDVWNSTPAWQFPYWGPGDSVTTAGGAGLPATMVEGALAQNVIGLTAYGYFDNTYYVEAGAYHGMNNPSTESPVNGGQPILGPAPYWRLAYTGQSGNSNWEVGTLGLAAKVATDGAGGPTDDFTDIGLDGQYQWLAGKNTLTVHAAYYHENQNLDGTNSLTGDTYGTQHLDTYNLSATYYYRRRYGATLAYLGANSSADAVDQGSLGSPANNQSLNTSINTIYAPGNKGASAYITQLDYMPWYNTQFSLQYMAFNKVNGSTQGASLNNYLMLGMWYAY
ncbi:hypothetical protein [Acidihalobacter prosperus]